MAAAVLLGVAALVGCSSGDNDGGMSDGLAPLATAAAPTVEPSTPDAITVPRPVPATAPTTMPATVASTITTSTTIAVDTPAWAPDGWTAADVSALGGVVGTQLEATGLTGPIDLDAGSVTLPDGSQWMLHNLIRSLDRLVPAAWPDQVASQLSAAVAARNAGVEPFDAIADDLRVSVGDVGLFGVSTIDLVSRPIAGNLVGVVMIGTAQSVAYVPAAALDAWGVTADDVYTRALRQTLSGPASVAGAGGGVQIDGDFFAATRILDPTSVIDAGPDGLIIAIPTTSKFTAIPVASMTEADLLALVDISVKEFDAAPDPASEDVFWWHDGTLDVITVTDSTVQLPQR